MNILFDLDGTLTDSYQGITRSICYALKKMGRTPPLQESLNWCIGPPLRTSLGLLLDTVDVELVTDALAAYRERFRTVGIFENEVYSGVPEMLEALKQKGYNLYVATSKPEIFANRIVDHFGLGRYFQGVYGCGLDGKRGDKKSLILHALTSEGINPAKATMVGDREYDMIGACENGVRGFGALWGYGSKEELEASGAYACFGTPADLVPVFSNNSEHL